MNALLRPATLSWPTLALLAVAGLLAALTGNPDASPGQRLAWLGAGVVAQGALTCCYLAGRVLRLDRNRAGVLAVVLVGAAARAATIAVLADSIGGEDPLDPGSRILVATVTFTAWGILLGAVVQSWGAYRTALRSLLLRVDHTLAEAEAFSREWHSRLATTSSSPASVAETAEDLHRDIQRRLRPLSHRLWFGVTDAQSWRRFGRALAGEPMPVAVIATVILALYAWNIAYHFGPAVALAIATVSAVGVAVVLAAAEFLSWRWPAHAPALRVTAIIGSALVAVAVDWRSSGLADGPGIGVVAIGLMALIIGIQGIAVGLRQRATTLRALGDRVDRLEAQRADIAVHLHSTLQSQWTAAALRLQGAAASGDEEAVRRALHDAHTLAHPQPREPATPLDLQAIADAWAGIASVRIGLPPGIPIDTHSALAGVVQEAVANAVRHGQARTIDVLVTVTDATVDVIVTDDGRGLAGTPRAGLGSSWLDRVSDWHLSEDPSGTRLIARIPIGAR